jgi:hypothetical protein
MQSSMAVVWQHPASEEADGQPSSERMLEREVAWIAIRLEAQHERPQSVGSRGAPHQL